MRNVEALGTPESKPRARVLIVEDEAIIAQDIRNRLVRLGYEVVGIADSGARAFILAAETQPNLVLMDIVIQGPLDGVRTATELMRRMDVPVIFLTALSDNATLERVKEFGPYGYLIKPFVEHELHIAAELALHRHKNDVQRRLLRQAELEKQASLSLVNATLDALEARVAIVDAQGAIVGTNRAWREAAANYGANIQATCEGQNYLSVCEGSEEGERVLRGLKDLLSGAISRLEFDYPCHFGEDRSWWTCSASRLSVGAQSQLVVAHHNVTQSKLSELARAESERRYCQVLDAISDFVVVSGPNAQLIMANRAYRELHGLGQSAHPAGEASLNGEARERLFSEQNQVFATGEPLDIADERVEAQDGSVVHLHTVRSPIVNPEGEITMVVGVSRDITERKQMEAQLRLADRMASVGSLAAGVAHEINTPVQFVSDSIHFVKQATSDLLALVEKIRKVESEALQAVLCSAEDEIDLSYLVEHMPSAVERAVDGLERISTIVKSMREFAHPDQKEAMPADISRGLRSTLIIARNEFKYVADEEANLGELPNVVCHMGDLNQVFLNLIVNASHAMADVHHVTGQRGVLGVRSWEEGEEVVIAISDTGNGIPEEIRARIFDPFFTTKEVGKGTGQGLAIARHIVVDKHRGKLSFTTQAQKGTTFFIRLPIHGCGKGAT